MTVVFIAHTAGGQLCPGRVKLDVGGIIRTKMQGKTDSLGFKALRSFSRMLHALIEK